MGERSCQLWIFGSGWGGAVFLAVDVVVVDGFAVVDDVANNGDD